MDVVVCLKQIIDPEAPARHFAVDPATGRQLRCGLSLVVSPYDQNAFEVALQLREARGGRITALSVGPPEAEAALRWALRMGADAAVLVSDPVLDDSDAFGIAHALAGAVRRLDRYDLVLAGCESGDLVEALVGPAVAEALGIGCVTYASRVEPADGAVRLRRSGRGGHEILQAALPLLVTIASDETNVPRNPKVREVLAAAKRPISTVGAAELGLDLGRVGAGAARLVTEDVEVVRHESRCVFIEGPDGAAKGRGLARRLAAMGLVRAEAG